MTRWLTPLLLCAACTAADPQRQGGDKRAGDSDPTATGTPTGLPTTGTLPTGTTTTPAVDCSALSDVPLSMTVYDIETTEDFDFDAEGRMVFAQWLGSALFGVDEQLNIDLISANIDDTRGISVLHDGTIITAYIGTGVVALIDPSNGAQTPLITGLGSPNALEVGPPGTIWFSETSGTPRVREYDIVSGTTTPVATGLSYPNGLVVDADFDTLYLSDSSQGVYRVDRLPTGEWGDKELLFNPVGFGSYDAMEIDACGNLYVLSFTSGRLMRMDPDEVPLQPVEVANLDTPNAFLWNAMHWGSDRGGWRRDTLYVTNRDKVFALELGVPGKNQPVDAMP